MFYKGHSSLNRTVGGGGGAIPERNTTHNRENREVILRNTKNVPEMMKDSNPQIQENQFKLSRIKKKI